MWELVTCAGHVGQACCTKMSEVRNSCWKCEDVFRVGGTVGCMQERGTWLRCVCEGVETGVRNFCQFHETTMT